jgi:hypothetical protein
MPEADMAKFWAIGAKLAISPVEQISNPDIVLDFSDARLQQFADSGRHASQLCGQLCGVQTSPIPDVRKVGVGSRSAGAVWGILNSASIPTTVEGERIDPTVLMQAKSGQFIGIIGVASASTYMSVAMGLPTIEILPVTRNRAWLSKWSSPTYRAVYESANLGLLLPHAQRNLEAVAEYIAGCSGSYVPMGAQ